MEQLFERILKGPDDDHWRRQVDLLGKHRKDAILIKLESLPAWYHKNMQVEFPHENRSEPYDEIDDELRDKVLAYYADDVELYNAAE